jgi:hypothetical protein
VWKRIFLRSVRTIYPNQSAAEQKVLQNDFVRLLVDLSIATRKTSQGAPTPQL